VTTDISLFELAFDLLTIFIALQFAVTSHDRLAFQCRSPVSLELFADYLHYPAVELNSVRCQSDFIVCTLSDTTYWAH